MSAPLTADEIAKVEKFRDELVIKQNLGPEATLAAALSELGIAGGGSLRDSFLLVEGEMRRSAELRAQAAALHSAGAEDFEDFEDDDGDDGGAAVPQPAPAPAAEDRPRSFSSESLLAQHGPTRAASAAAAEGDSGWGGWISGAADALASAARGDGGGRVVVDGEPRPPSKAPVDVDDGSPGAVCVYGEDGSLIVTFLKQGPIGVAFDPPTWPRVLKIEPNSLSTKLKELKPGLVLYQIEGIDVARVAMSEAFPIFQRAGVYTQTASPAPLVLACSLFLSVALTAHCCLVTP